MSMQRSVADVLGAKVYVKIQRNKPTRKAAVAESKARYGNKPGPEKIIAFGSDNCGNIGLFWR